MQLHVYTQAKMATLHLPPLSGLQGGRGGPVGRRGREGERKTQCGPETMLQSHNHHSGADCMQAGKGRGKEERRETTT